MSAISDLEIYRRFVALAEELDEMFAKGPSLIGGTALHTAAQTLRGMASAIYEHSLSETEDNAQ